MTARRKSAKRDPGVVRAEAAVLAAARGYKVALDAQARVLVGSPDGDETAAAAEGLKDALVRMAGAAILLAEAEAEAGPIIDAVQAPHYGKGEARASEPPA